MLASRYCSHSSISCCAPGPIVTHRYSCDPLRPMFPILACSCALLGHLNTSITAVSITSSSLVSSPGMSFHLMAMLPIAFASSSLCCTTAWCRHRFPALSILLRISSSVCLPICITPTHASPVAWCMRMPGHVLCSWASLAAHTSSRLSSCFSTHWSPCGTRHLNSS